MCEDFLNEEIRSGYVVNAKMKRVWKTEIDILVKFIEICEKHRLKYYLAGGTLLGCIRHKGFIPWDDDIDIDMPREDYDKFAKIAIEELNGKFYFQNTYTDSNYVRPHAQIRNSETTAIVMHEKGLKFNQGIFIDIFPLDAVPSNIIARFFHKNLIAFFSILFKAGIMVNPKDETRALKRVAHYLCSPVFKVIDYRRAFAMFEDICSYYNKDISLPIGEISFDYSNKCIWDRKCFNDDALYQFEYILCRVPAGYDTILKTTFGSYMVPSREPSYHGEIFFDVDNAYTKYIKLLS